MCGGGERGIVEGVVEGFWGGGGFRGAGERGRAGRMRGGRGERMWVRTEARDGLWKKRAYEDGEQKGRRTRGSHLFSLSISRGRPGWPPRRAPYRL